MLCYSATPNMRNFFFILTLTVFSFANCKERTHSNSPLSFVDTTKPFKKEIPTYLSGGVDIFYDLAKVKQKQLGLDSLENGFTNLQIRVWYDFSLVRERKLVVITNKDTNWVATVYDLQVDWDGQTETILSKKVKQVTPKSGWGNFSKKLLDLKVLSLPNQNDIPSYGGGNDGRTYNVEVATKNQYRFYGYWEPQEYQDKFWQAKNMADILKLFETELGV
jgi:hypothetical protein